MPAAPKPAKGLDVSSFQGDINWQQVAADGYTFAIIRCGSGWKGGYTDPRWQANHDGAKAAGLTVGAYYFAYAGHADPATEAERILALVKPQAGDIVPTLDLEVTDGRNAGQLTEWALAWLQRVDAAIKAKAMLYTYPAFLAGSLKGGLVFANRPLWYASRNDIWPKTPPGFSQYNVLQSRDDGVVKGIPGKVDLDVSYGLSRVLIPTPPTPKPQPKRTPPAVLKERRGYWAWVCWRLGEGAWRGYTPADPTVRPNLPRAISGAWWRSLAAFLHARKH